MNKHQRDPTSARSFALFSENRINIILYSYEQRYFHIRS